jgi:hypothetical protein
VADLHPRLLRRFVAVARELHFGRARGLADSARFESRFHGGFGAAFRSLLAHRVDVAFGRSTGSWHTLDETFRRRVVRFEPLGLLLLDDHPLAERASVPMAAIAGLTIDTGGGNTAAPEWVELGAALVAEHGGTVASDHHPGMDSVAVAPADEPANHMRTTGWPILTMTDIPPVPGTVIRALVDPVPLYPWTMVHRRAVRHPGLDALEQAVDQIVAEKGWHDLPDHPWFAGTDRQLLDSRRRDRPPRSWGANRTHRRTRRPGQGHPALATGRCLRTLTISVPMASIGGGGRRASHATRNECPGLVDRCTRRRRRRLRHGASRAARSARSARCARPT